MPKIGLGTVQLGMPYGNSSTVMKKEEAFDILDFAIMERVSFFDTSPEYGKAEEILGEYNLSKFQDIEISTKVPKMMPGLSEGSMRAFVKYYVEKSMVALKISTFGLLQFHQSDLGFLTSRATADVMQWCLDQGYADTIGVSVYTPEEALAAMEIPCVKAIQCPINLVDHRFISDEMVGAFNRHRVRVIARSIFLQGVLIDRTALPICQKTRQLEELRRLCRVGAICLAEQLPRLAVNFVKRLDEVDIMLFGVDSSKSFQETIKLTKKAKFQDSALEEKAFKPAVDYATEHRLYDPRIWAR